jgi:hypothetical protein
MIPLISNKGWNGRMEGEGSVYDRLPHGDYIVDDSGDYRGRDITPTSCHGCPLRLEPKIQQQQYVYQQQ